MGNIDFGPAFNAGWEGFSKNIVPLAVGFLVALVMSLFIITIPFTFAGYVYICLRAIRGENVEVGDVFYGFSDAGRFFIAGLLIAVFNVIGLMACGFGVLITGPISLFVFPYMIDKEASFGEAFGECWRYFKRDWLMLILMAVAVSIIFYVGFVGVVLGFLFTGPFAGCVGIAAYMQVFGKEAPPPAERPI